MSSFDAVVQQLAHNTGCDNVHDKVIYVYLFTILLI